MTHIPKPEGSLWTDDQWQAICARGEDILVAAAAGSGKTAVLVERLINRIIDEEDPVDVDRLLIVTFTNAAAAEMKKRIGEALEEQLEKQPHSLYLKRQISLLNRASISTLHSFCLEILRNDYFQLDLDPKFRVADDTEIALIQEEVLEALFEARYSQEDHDGFYELVDRFSSDRTDMHLQRMVLQLYEFSRSHPFPEAWLDQIVESYRAPLTKSGQENDILKSAQALLAQVESSCFAWLEQLDYAEDMIHQPRGPHLYAGNIADDKKVVQALGQAVQQGWDATALAFQEASFSRLKSGKSDEIDPHLQNKVKDIRDRIKKEIKAYQEALFTRSLEAYTQDVIEMGPYIETLIFLVKDFHQRYTQQKKVKGILDFSDLEHLTLQILMDEHATPDSAQPSEVAKTYQYKFVEVLVDEYQDTNMVQEAILQLVTARQEGKGHLFMVGDVKQSIYRFRMAEPGLFIHKYKAFRPNQGDAFQQAQQGQGITKDIEDQRGDMGSGHGDIRSHIEHIESKKEELPATSTEGTDRTTESGLRIDLNQNFRSRAQVLDGTNYIFKQVMNEEVGEIAYDAEAELKVGAAYPSAETPIDVCIIDKEEREHNSDQEENDEDEEQLRTGSASIQEEIQELETVQLEARFMATKIRALIGHQGEAFQVYDQRQQQHRPLQYRDIVILLRATSVWAPTILEELKQQGIPAYAELTSGYFEATEVAVMISLLKVIDNPYQDIPLASVLRSPIVRLDGEQMAKIRVYQQGGSYYEALQQFLQANEQVDASLSLFCQRLQDWRTLARQGSLADLIWRIYQETGYFDYVGGMPGGHQRQANLRALYDRARQYESTSFRGLFRFLRFIERMQDRGSDLGTARALSEQEDVVRVMTIHKSKGLEFPVVFVAGLGKGFNKQDLNQKLLLHKELGLASKYIDTVQRISYPTLPFLHMREQIRSELLAEEMRVLYVALTRAKEKLVLVGTLKDTVKRVGSWIDLASHSAWVLPNHHRAAVKCYLDWIGSSLVRHRQGEPLWEKAQQSSAQMKQQEEIYAHPSEWHVQFIPASSLTVTDDQEQEINEGLLQTIARWEPVSPEHADPAYKELVSARLEWHYSHLQAEKQMAKLSVTEIKRQREYLRRDAAAFIEDSRLIIGQNRATNADRPKFLQERSLTATEKGTAMHSVMQHIPLNEKRTEEEWNRIFHQFVEREILTADEEQAIQVQDIIKFQESELFTLLQKASWIKRELPFSYTLPVEEIHQSTEPFSLSEEQSPISVEKDQERVLIQGVIDCLFEYEGKLYMVDYKTDSIYDRFSDFEQAKAVLLKRYQLQLELYAKAVEGIWKEEVAHQWLYFFDGGHLLSV